MALILLVDDDPLLRGVIRDILERAGHAVQEAGDGDMALAQYRASKPDLMLLDIIMPNKEGVETILELRKLDTTLPVIAMSSGGRFGTTLFLEFAECAGAQRTLTKPIRKEALLAAVCECLASPRDDDETVL